MVITDPIADMLMRIRNAGAAGKTFVAMPFSDIKFRIANLLLNEGYVASVEKKAKKGKPAERILELGVSYDGPRQPRVRGMERISRPSRRLYAGAKDIRKVNQGHGIMILSTPKGILSGDQARKEHVGGEIICKVW